MMTKTPAGSDPLTDLTTRWRCARRAALRAVVPSAAGDEDEDQLLTRALTLDCAGTLRRVFDNSLTLGAGFARFYQTEPALEDLPAVLGQLGTPCAAGTWTTLSGDPAARLDRAGCPAAAQGAAACDYWREAISGLVLGMSGVLHARHASLGHKDPACADVFFTTRESAHRFGPIPEEVRETLAGAERLAKRFNPRAEIEFLGLSEGVLYYLEERRGGEVSAAAQLKSFVQRRFPHLSLRELSPRPVLVGENPWQTTTR